MTPLWMIVGLGNPGPEYRGTRHNVGFDVLDRLAEKHRIKLDKTKHQARHGLGDLDGTPVLLVRPLTYMNLSGQAVAPLMKTHGLKPERVLVVTDDLDLPVGKIRVRAEGSAGGHNGHRSLIATLGTTVYPRIKIGIGSVDKSKTIGHVLGKFHPNERDAVDEALSLSVDAIEAILSEGLEAAMNRFNPGK